MPRNPSELLRTMSALALTCALSTSCARRPAPPPGPELYSELKESLEGVDTTALEGVRIVLDPGHGGRYAGALGPSGIREADVNLGVALHLWGLLSDAGADVTLTRSSDRTVAGDEETSLRQDLLARSEIANDYGADLFISLHHNSSLSRDPGLNKTETYHKLFDSGPSEDAARALHNHLSFNIGETRGGVIPGNYLVLRSCDGAAVLGEPSFISNPKIESKLKEGNVQRMEASAYFLGIVDYFSKGVPRLERIAPSDQTKSGPDVVIELTADPGGEAGIAEADIELLMDGLPISAEYDAYSGLVRHTPTAPMTAGVHTVEARARNTAGNWSPTLEFTLEVETEPAHLLLNPGNSEGGAPGTPLAIEALAYDENMNPVADGTPIIFSCNRPVFPETTYVHSGRALCYVMPGPGGSYEIRAFCGEVSMGLAADPSVSVEDEPTWWAFLRDSVDGSPIEGAAVNVGALRLGVSNQDGLVSFAEPQDTSEVWRVSADGYEWRIDGPPKLKVTHFEADTGVDVRTLEMKRAAAGLFEGQIIVLDPEGGGDDRAGQGPSGVDASWVNYEVASALASMIESAGGRAVLTRERNGGASDVERLKISERVGASRYLLISHRPPSKNGGAWIGYYPRSETGKGLAEAIAARWTELLEDEPPAVIENASYAVRQTSCAAIYINLMPLSDRSAERHLSKTWNTMREAYIIYAGLLEHLDTEGALAGGEIKLELRRPNGRRARGASVRIDGYLTLSADDSGEVPLTALTPGIHQLEATLQGYKPTLQDLTWPPSEADSKLRIVLLAR